MNEIKKAIIIPSDPISAYEANGYGGWLERYYNPSKVFSEVFLVSPFEKGITKKYGATIIGSSASDFKNVIKDILPDVIRAYDGFKSSDIAINNKVDGIPVVVSLHDTSLSLMYDSISKADMLLCMSSAVKKNAIIRGAIPERIRILPNRIDRKIFKPVDYSILSNKFSEGKYILHIGRKSVEKNIESVVSALKYLPDEYKAIFIGNGDSRKYVEFSKRENVSNRCFWIQSVKNEELPIWYSWCNCMCTPSLSEGFGIVFIEALSCGAIVVTSNIAPLNEYMKNEENAYLVDDYTNGQSIALCIRKATELNEKNELISKMAIQSSERFSVEKIDEIEKGFYLEVVAKGNK